MDEALQQVMAVFAEEFHEQSQAITQALLEVQRSPVRNERKALMAGIFRQAHSIKGNAGTMGLKDVESLAHAIETALLEFRDGQRPPPPDFVLALLRSLDLAHRRVQSQRAGNDAEEPLLAEAGAALLVAGATAAEPESASPQSLEPTHSTRSQPRETLRVSLERLTALDRKVDDLREVRAALELRAQELHRLCASLANQLHRFPNGLDAQASRAVHQQLDRVDRRVAADLADLQGHLGSVEEELRMLRMVPAETLFAPLYRAVFEQARNSGKSARLEVAGARVSLDRRVLDELKDPLLHLVRNSVDHGIESASERLEAGKPPEGVVTISVEQRGAQVVMILADDGRGLALGRIRARAVEKGLFTEECCRDLSADELHELLFIPGFSTAESLTLTSGRGIGLDVVRENLQRVGGSVGVTSVMGQGTRFSLEVPLTLATAQVLAFEVGGITMTLPLHQVARAEHHSTTRSLSATLDLGGQPLQVHSLAALLHLPERPGPGQNAVVVAEGSEGPFAFHVERLLGEREVVIRPNPPELGKLRHLSASAAMGDGRIAFILNVRALVERAQAMTRLPEPPAPAAAPRARLCVLVADDSVTTRTVHRNSLRAAGFEVRTAADGEEALRLLHEVRIDLLVSDIHMPRLDGLGLTRAVRQEADFASLPVILISSLDSDEARSIAEEAGASAYLPKGLYARSALLAEVRRLLGLADLDEGNGQKPVESANR